MSIRKLTPLARRFNNGVVMPETRSIDPLYHTQVYRAWARFVINRAGQRCEAIDDGMRCRKAFPDHRMFADHIVELQDGGSAFDPTNGQCLCGSHHTIKTMIARAQRMGSH